jgi:hypothetical protein
MFTTAAGPVPSHKQRTIKIAQGRKPAVSNKIAVLV